MLLGHIKSLKFFFRTVFRFRTGWFCWIRFWVGFLKESNYHGVGHDFLLLQKTMLSLIRRFAGIHPERRDETLCNGYDDEILPRWIFSRLDGNLWKTQRVLGDEKRLQPLVLQPIHLNQLG